MMMNRSLDSNNQNHHHNHHGASDEEASLGLPTVKVRPSLQRDQVLVAGLKLSCYRISDAHGHLVQADLEDAIANRNRQLKSKKNGGISFTAGDAPAEKSNEPPNKGPSPQNNNEKDKIDAYSYWIDADVRDGDDALELHKIIQSIRLTPFLQNHLSKPHQIYTPQVLSLNKSVFLVMRVLPPEEDTSNDARYVAALSVKGLLLTVTTCPQHGAAARAGQLLNQSTRHAVEERELPEASTSGALAMWLLFHVQRVASVAQVLRKECFALEDKMDADMDTIELDDLFELKSKVNMMVAVSEEQLECVENLKEGETITSGLDFSKLRGSMGLVLATAGANERMMGRLERKVADLRNGFDSHQQAQINHRLELLTILSAIFLPLTLMAGLWGMNFSSMPELDSQNGYYFALAGMAAVAITLLIIFYRYGWFQSP